MHPQGFYRIENIVILWWKKPSVTWISSYAALGCRDSSAAKPEDMSSIHGTRRVEGETDSCGLY